MFRMAREVFIVLDLMGGGRVVGVFDTAKQAQRVIGDFPQYFKLFRHELNRVGPEVLGWAQNAAQEAHLRQFIGRR